MTTPVSLMDDQMVDMAFITQLTGKQNLGVAAISIMFLIGYYIFHQVTKIKD